jgi:hypothetical protein
MVNLVYSNARGKIFEDPRYLMLGARGLNFILPSREELIKLPPFAKIFFIPDSPAMGFNKKTGRIESLDKNQNTVSAFLPPGYLRTLLPAIEFKSVEKALLFNALISRRDEVSTRDLVMHTEKNLPLWAYTALGIKNKEFYACAIRIDKYEKWNPENYNDRKLLSNAKNLKKRFGNNPLFNQLFKCATIYHCFTAKNFFLGYPELAVPLSIRCNASCIGCISLQTETNFPSSQERIINTPALKEVLEIIEHHIGNVHPVRNGVLRPITNPAAQGAICNGARRGISNGAEEPIISFGQGCEGEPLLEVGLISKIIKNLKPSYKNVTFNINTNGSLTKNLKRLIKAGLDTARISINSADKERYELYFRPKGYDFNDVVKSIKTLKDGGVYVMLNVLVFPGITDGPDETNALIRLIKNTKPDMLQLRNLNIDPRLYLSLIRPKEKSTGIISFLKTIRQAFPSLKIGSFNRPKSYFRRS